MYIYDIIKICFTEANMAKNKKNIGRILIIALIVVLAIVGIIALVLNNIVGNNRSLEKPG